jgi:localization factor PodJL
MEGVGQMPRPYRDHDDSGDGLGGEFAAVNDRLDELARQLEGIAQTASGRRTAMGESGQPSPDGVAEALARLDRRLDQMISEGRAASSRERERHPAVAPSAALPPSAPSLDPASWVAQIAARQRVLDGDASPPPAPTVPQQLGSRPDLTGLEQQLRDIRAQIASLQQPYEDGIAALRLDLAEVGRTLNETVPSRTVEALEAQMGMLAERIDRSREAGADGTALAALEQELAEVRDALRGLTPVEGLAGFEEAVRGLSSKIDQIGLSGDPTAFKQLEQAVVSLRGVMSNAASEQAQLAAEVHGLASGVERAALMDGGRIAPPELEAAMRLLGQRIDRLTLSEGDQLALTSLEDRIAKLSEKLDGTDARLGNLEAIERGLADLLVYLDELRGGPPRGLRTEARPDAAEPAPEPPPAPVPPAASPLDLIPAYPEPSVVEPPPQSPDPLSAGQEPSTAPGPAMVVPPVEVAASSPDPVVPPSDEPTVAAPRAPLPTAPPVAIEARRPPVKPNGRSRPEPRRPIDPDLPPDTPIEPGAGVPRVRTSSAAARIAASEAVLGASRPMPDETGGRSAAIAAARKALNSSYVETPAKAPTSPASSPPSLFTWFKKARNAQLASPALPALPAPSTVPEASPPSTMPEPGFDAGMEQTEPSSNRILKHLKTILVAASVAIIVAGAVQTALDLLMPGDSVDVAAPASLDAPDGATPIPLDAPKAASPGPSSNGPSPEAPAAPRSPDTTESIGRQSSFFDGSNAAVPKHPLADITGSIPRAPAAGAAATNPHAPALPETTSAVLRTAVAAHDPAAEYEMASRYAEGRGVPQDLEEAARWFERAANAGFVPAQFRLAGLNEKGEGVKKDVHAARRLYQSAANKGHAKAMHNLAVLYAEGVDGRPDYKAAAQWFRKAAAYGIADSQYNLAILYARGIGVEANLAESYKWFAIASGRGDQDAAAKRDQVAARLDPQTLMAAKLAVQTFVAEREPEDATSLKAPPGGWDRAPAQPAKPRPRASASPTR